VRIPVTQPRAAVMLSFKSVALSRKCRFSEIWQDVVPPFEAQIVRSPPDYSLPAIGRGMLISLLSPVLDLNA
jgi:hypothetical protein